MLKSLRTQDPENATRSESYKVLVTVKEPKYGTGTGARFSMWAMAPFPEKSVRA